MSPINPQRLTELASSTRPCWWADARGRQARSERPAPEMAGLHSKAKQSQESAAAARQACPAPVVGEVALVQRPHVAMQNLPVTCA